MRKLSALLFAIVLVCSSIAVAQAAPAPAAPAADQPKVGDSAPTFKLDSNEGTPVSLSDYKGKWVILYFYPKDMTKGCTIEAHNFQRDLDKYQKANAVVLGVSVDDVGSHKEFCAKESLTFKLLADTTAKTSQAYGSTMVYKEKTYSARHTFIVTPDGKIAKVYPNVDANVNAHSDDVLVALAELQASYKPPAMPKKK